MLTAAYYLIKNNNDNNYYLLCKENCDDANNKKIMPMNKLSSASPKTLYPNKKQQVTTNSGNEDS